MQLDNEKCTEQSFQIATTSSYIVSKDTYSQRDAKGNNMNLEFPT